MHPSMTRLLLCAQEATKGQRRAITDFKDLGARLGESSAVISNWKSRGISKAGALKASRLFGCSATWLMDGKGAPGNPDARLTEEAPTGPDALDEALEVLSKVLTELDEEARSSVGHSLARLAQDPSKLGNISQIIRTLVFTNATKSHATDTRSKGQRLTDLPRGIGPEDDGEDLRVSPAQRGQQK
jgi:hypothetical protein